MTSAIEWSSEWNTKSELRQVGNRKVPLSTHSHVEVLKDQNEAPNPTGIAYRAAVSHYELRKISLADTYADACSASEVHPSSSVHHPNAGDVAPEPSKLVIMLLRDPVKPNEKLISWKLKFSWDPDARSRSCKTWCGHQSEQQRANAIVMFVLSITFSANESRARAPGSPSRPWRVESVGRRTIERHVDDNCIPEIFDLIAFTWAILAPALFATPFRQRAIFLVGREEACRPATQCAPSEASRLFTLDASQGITSRISESVGLIREVPRVELHRVKLAIGDIHDFPAHLGSLGNPVIAQATLHRDCSCSKGV